MMMRLTIVAAGSLSVAAAAFLLAACATTRQAGPAIAKVNPCEHCRLSGGLGRARSRDRRIGCLGIRQTSACIKITEHIAAARSTRRSTSIGRSGRVTNKDSRRRAIVRGVFRNRVGVRRAGRKHADLSGGAWSRTA